MFCTCAVKNFNYSDSFSLQLSWNMIDCVISGILKCLRDQHFCTVVDIWSFYCYFIKKELVALLFFDRLILHWLPYWSNICWRNLNSMDYLRNKKLCPGKHTKFRSPVSLYLQCHCVLASFPAILLPFCLIVCCFVGGSCLMLNEDRITKPLFFS